MKSTNAFLTFSKIVLVTVFLVILAGGVVRMTQSGMGCPDWPKCFGKWIPPSSVDQLPANYKELYAFKYVDTSFNPYHTWIEYINRLLGTLLGLLLLIQFFWSLRFLKTSKNIVWLSLATLLLTGFQGWLGSKVVATNLEAAKITTHMLVALLIAALSVTIVYLLSFKNHSVENKGLRIFSVLTIFLLLIQIVLGTQVREQIDHISVRLNFEKRESWISDLNYIFYIHRTFSIVIAGLCLYLFVQCEKYQVLKPIAWLILFSVLGNIVLGIVMTYLNVPAIAQPLHLLLSSVLMVSVYYSFLASRSLQGVNKLYSLGK